MSEVDRLVVEAKIRDAWGGRTHLIPARGGFLEVPPVREGGTTAALIKIAAEVADRHYKEAGR